MGDNFLLTQLIDGMFLENKTKIGLKKNQVSLNPSSYLFMMILQNHTVHQKKPDSYNLKF